MKPLLLDGPMGTELERLGEDTSPPLWSARSLLDNPELVRNIHVNSIRAGADVITTNTFRTQERTLRKIGLENRGKLLTEEAVAIAKEAAKGNSKIKIAGSIAPLEDCYSPHLVPNNHALEVEHRSMVENLFDSGVDIFLIETMNTVREAQVAVKIALEYDQPVWLGLTVNEAGNPLSGEKWQKLMTSMTDFPELILVNCSTPRSTDLALNKLKEYIDKNDLDIGFGFYPNYLFDLEKGRSVQIIRNELIYYTQKWLKFGPRVIGTCCGALPEDTSALRKLIDSF